MTYKIHFEHRDGTEDSFTISANTIEEIRTKAKVELEKRGGSGAWSEEL